MISILLYRAAQHVGASDSAGETLGQQNTKICFPPFRFMLLNFEKKSTPSFLSPASSLSVKVVDQKFNKDVNRNVNRNVNEHVNTNASKNVSQPVSENANNMSIDMPIKMSVEISKTNQSTCQ